MKRLFQRKFHGKQNEKTDYGHDSSLVRYRYGVLFALCVLLATSGPALAAVPVAGFTTVSPAGDYPAFLVKFTDTSENTPTEWSWTFTNVTGNNTPVVFSTIQNPYIIFTSNGNYSVQLNSSNSDGFDITAPVFYNLSDCNDGDSCNVRIYTAYDGAVRITTAGTWAGMRNAAAGTSIWSNPYNPSQVLASGTAGTYANMYKTLTTFDTSGVPSASTITGVNAVYWGSDFKINALEGQSPGLSLIDADPSNPASYATSDWSRTAYLRQADDISYNDWVLTGPNTFTSVNTSYITKGGTTVLGTALNWIVDNQEPTWSADSGVSISSCSVHAPSENVCYGNISYLDISYDKTYGPSPPEARYSVIHPDGYFPDMRLTLTDTSTNVSTSWGWTATNVTGNNTPFTFATTSEAKITLGVGNWSIQHTAANADGENTTVPVFFNLSECSGTLCTHRFYPSNYGGIENTTNSSWSGKREAMAGNSLWEPGTIWYLPIPMPSRSPEGVYGHWIRLLFTYPTSALTDSVYITDATVKMWGAGKSNSFTSPNATIIDVSPSDSANYAFDDWSRTTYTRLSSDVAYADFDITPGPVNFILNNRSYINQTGNTSFFFSNNFITDNEEPTPWVNDAFAYLMYCDAGAAEAGVCKGLDNTLEVTYSLVPPSRPTVTAVSPASGPMAGGTLVTLTGTGFTGATAVMFGATAGTGITVNSDTNITVTAPAHTAGTVYITVTTTGGTSATAQASRYAYAVPPGITAVLPASGPTAGGNLVTLTGTGFTGATAVRFGTTAGTGMTVNTASNITVIAPAHVSGTVYVTVTTPGGTSITTSGSRYTYILPPGVTNVSPASGSVTGGTRVTLTGTGFTGATAVMFGAAAGTGMTVNSSTRITVTSPAGTAGTVYVTVITPGGSSANISVSRYMYTSVPTVTAVSPSSGPTAAGSRVTLTGNGFTGATAVRFGTTAGTSMTVNSSTRITVTAPAHAAGSVYVTVTTPAGTSATGTANRYTYVARPNVTAISPSSGPTAAGSRVTLTGNGFTGATAVMFGTTAGTSMTVNSSSRITVTAPAHAAGAVYVTVTTPGGTSATNASANRYTYVARPNVTAISPSSGPTAAGSRVTLTGNGFTGATAVMFGTTAGTSMTVNSSSRITVTAPAHAAGAVYITVTTPGGTSATNASANRYTYMARPNITAISPSSGPAAGGTRVTLTGNGFTGATAVRFGTTAGTSMTVNSSSRITVTAPAHAAGAVDVTVTTPGGTSAAVAADRYTYS